MKKFTLIELLVVISIMLILTGIILPKVTQEAEEVEHVENETGKVVKDKGCTYLELSNGTRIHLDEMCTKGFHL